jgi:hypothetical protein
MTTRIFVAAHAGNLSHRFGQVKSEEGDGKLEKELIPYQEIQ